MAEGLYDLEQIAPRICKEGHAEPHCGYVVCLASDRQVSALQFFDDSVNAIDAETRVVPAKQVVTSMQIFISGSLCCARAGHQLEMETIVSSGVQKTEAEAGHGH